MIDEDIEAIASAGRASQEDGNGTDGRVLPGSAHSQIRNTVAIDISDSRNCRAELRVGVVRIQPINQACEAARVVVDEPPLATEALVVSIIDGGAFERSTKGLVAVPAEFADALARASSRGNAIVLVAP